MYMKKKTTDISNLSEKLISNGYKITKQRCEIIKAIYENSVHMNADEIYKKVKHKKIGLSTVYRNLMILETVGIIKRINAANTSYYELQTIGEIDIHAKCIRCNKIVDIKKEKLEENAKKLIKNIKQERGSIINSASIVLSVICEKCKSEIILNRDSNKGRDG
ncbi:transcriptional repressor [Clostridium drakei]|uniref:Transcriptional repressor n=2 Tax=Clostridium drakei TaxID=332101 RepID=A0A2U8DZ27_9CLOT|nr:transcriptional repressor [Clostridium drakei]